jgi:carboxyl-terminal processing protease
LKSNIRPLAVFSALALALITASTAWSLRTAIRLDAPTPEGQTVQLTAQLLEQAQYAHEKLTAALASKFLDRYCDSLDGTREVLFQSDVDEFHHTFANLAETLKTKGDTQPAHAIFTRFLERIGQRQAFADKVLAEGKFDFTGEDHFSLDREKAARPQDAAAAEALWRERLKAEYLQEKLAGKKPEQITQTLTHRYESQAKTMKKFSPETVLEIYLDSLAHVYDPHSDYMDHEQLDSFNTIMRLSLAGIGATLQEEDGYCKIRELVPGGPAAKSGKVKVGDRIVGVSQNHGKDTTDLIDLPLPQAVELIRGPKGTDVTLTIIPVMADAGVRKTITIQRDEIRLEEQRAKARIVEFPDAGGATMRLGVIDLPAFYASDEGKSPSATADVTELVKKLETEHVRGLILDLRRNGGGSLEEAINLTGLFISSGPVVQTRDLSGHVEVGDDRGGKKLYEGPLVVLTSRLTASASEIVSGALQDYGRAIVVGDTSTFGKGTVQTMLMLSSIMERSGVKPASDPGALKVTISKFYRPSGNSTQLRGVSADIVLPSATDNPDIGESGMKNPLPWDTVPPALYDHFDLVKPYVGKLRQGSEARVSADREFGWLKEDLARTKSDRESKTVSLNEAERRKTLDDSKVQTKAHNADLQAHSDPVPTVYEITVQNAGTAGLPAPLDQKKAAAVPDESKDEGNADAEPTTTTPAHDLQLRETEHILEDYVHMVDHGKEPIVTER